MIISANRLNWKPREPAPELPMERLHKLSLKWGFTYAICYAHRTGVWSVEIVCPEWEQRLVSQTKEGLKPLVDLAEETINWYTKS